MKPIIPTDAKTYILTIDEMGEAIANYLSERHGFLQNCVIEWIVDPDKPAIAGERIVDPTFIVTKVRRWS